MIDADLIERFANGWSRSRQVPAPVREGPALRVEVGLPDQQRRYVFLTPPEGLADHGAAIDAPFVHLKAAFPAEAVADLLPPHWHVAQTGTFMTVDSLDAAAPDLPAGYFLETAEVDGVFACWINDAAGEQAARGKLVCHDDWAQFDRIHVHEDHRRRGLGRALMQALGAAARINGAERGFLTATEMGRALYETLGWEARAPWTTAQIRA